MVVALGPGRFYGSSLPRPRFYTDVKLNEERVDPPLPVMDPFLSWANDAHWSMGGLSFNRHRLQGRIEGSIKKLRAQGERDGRTMRRKEKNQMRMMMKKKKRKGLVEEEEEDMPPSLDQKKSSHDTLLVSSVVVGGGKKRVRKLGDEFDKIAVQQQQKMRKEGVLLAADTPKKMGTNDVKSSAASSATATVMDPVASRTRSRKPTKEEKIVKKEASLRARRGSTTSPLV